MAHPQRLGQPFRTTVPAGGPSTFGGPLPAANLFSSIVLPEPSSMMTDMDDGDSAGSPGGSAGKAGSKAAGRSSKTADQRQNAIQEKNRRAQKRFRERQKAKMRDMGEQLEVGPGHGGVGSVGGAVAVTPAAGPW